MTPEQKVKWLILKHLEQYVDGYNAPEYPCEDIDKAYENDILKDWYGVANEVRQGDIQTDIPPPYSRHYESMSMASQLPDLSWVGWTYWYGGGKHGEPEAIDWMEDAYDLECHEEEKVVVVRTFKEKQNG